MTTQTKVQTQTMWELDTAQTRMEFIVKNMLVRTVKGRFTQFQGRIAGSVDNPADAEIDVTINAASIDTGNQRRDEHLRHADFLDVEKYPNITFKSTHIEPAGQNLFRVTGDLTLRDVTRPVELEASIDATGRNAHGQETAGLTVTGVLPREEWGVKGNWLARGGVMVGRMVTVQIQVEAVKMAEIETVKRAETAAATRR